MSQGNSDMIPDDKLSSCSHVVSPLFGRVPLDFLVQGDFHQCPYLPGRVAREEMFRALEFPPELYHDFMDHGFRRSGYYFYRPVCPRCKECRPIRVVVPGHRLTKSLRRIINKNRDVALKIGKPRVTAEKHSLYCRYLEAQHNGYQSSAIEDLRRFLYNSAVHTLEFEYRLLDRLIAVGIVDVCSRSLSTVYAYYEPEFSHRSLGTFSALEEIRFCREHGVPYYYLGYYVAGCKSMSYKNRFEPNEILDLSTLWWTKG